jgi:hypothetical protein
MEKKLRSSTLIKIKKVTKSKLDNLKRPGQTYDGAIQELINKGA